jgi:hypothetical protein
MYKKKLLITPELINEKWFKLIGNDVTVTHTGSSFRAELNNYY